MTQVQAREWRRYGFGGPPEPWERGVLIELRDRGVIADDVLHVIQREIDLEQLRTEA